MLPNNIKAAQERTVDLYDMLHEKKIFTLAEINSYLNAERIELSRDQWLHLLSQMIGHKVFLWIEIISEKIKDIANDDADFIELLAQLTSKIKFDWAMGLVAKSLTSVSYGKPELGLAIHQQIKSTKNPSLIAMSGYLLAGIVRKDLEGTLAIMRRELDKNNKAQKIAFINAIIEGLHDIDHMESAQEVFDFVGTLSDGDLETCRVLTIAYFELFKHNPDWCRKRLQEFLDKKNQSLNFLIAQLLTIRSIPDSGFEWQLIEKLSQSHEGGVLDELLGAMAHRVNQRPAATLEIVRRWIENDDYYKVVNIDWLLEETRKAKPDDVLGVFESWIGLNARLNFHIPKLLATIFRKAPSPLVERLDLWLRKDSSCKVIAIHVFDELLSEVYRERGDTLIVPACLSIISKFAHESGVDVTKIIKGEDDELFQCLILLDELEVERRPIDYGEIFRNLDFFPDLKGFLGEEWFEKMRREDNRTHDLLKLLATCKVNHEDIERLTLALRRGNGKLQRWALAEQIRSCLYPLAFLKHLDLMTSAIQEREKGTADLRDGLKNPDQFWQTVSEVELVGKLRFKGVPVEIKPEIKGHELDLKITFGTNTILIEVINPEMWRTLRLVSGAHATPNRVRRKFPEEFEQHLKANKDLKVPVLIVADVSRSEIEEGQIRDFLEGTLQFTWKIDKTTGKVVETSLSRAEDSMGETTPELNVISGCILYKRFMGNDIAMTLGGKYIKNANAVNKVEPYTASDLLAALFS